MPPKITAFAKARVNAVSSPNLLLLVHPEVVIFRAAGDALSGFNYSAGSLGISAAMSMTKKAVTSVGPTTQRGPFFSPFAHCT